MAFVNGNITVVCQLSPAFGTEEKIWNSECIFSDFEWGGIIEKEEENVGKAALLFWLVAIGAAAPPEA